MNKNQSFQKIEKEVESMASLLVFQESLIEKIKMDKEDTMDASKKNENQVVYN